MNRNERIGYGMVGIILLAIVLVCAFGCKPVVQTVTTEVHDTTFVLRTITQRDTVFSVPADAASASLATDVASMEELMRQLQHEQRVFRGERNASLVLSNDAGRLRIEARCDSVEMALQNAITTIQEKTTRLQSSETTITRLEQAAREKELRFKVPGWLKGTNWLIGLLTAAFIVFKLINKFL